MKNGIKKEIWIKAAVEKVFACFTEEQSMLAWHGKKVILDPKPGGVYHVTFENGTTIDGQYLEVVPNKKLVYSARYGDVDSTIRIDFIEKDGGTLVKLFQQFGAGQDTTSFNEGWDYFLGMLPDLLE